MATPSPVVERGAVLALAAMCLFVFMIIAALAVDLSALEARGQTLQNTADAAALAGVATWQETGDAHATEETIRDLLRQNGVGGADIDWRVEYIDPVQIEFLLSDSRPDMFLGGFVPGFGGTLERAASARLESCDNGCNTVVELRPPFLPTHVEGSGDGYYPISVGNRFYAINHDGDRIACVDRESARPCWPGRAATPYSGPVSGPVAHAVAIGTRIFWSAQDTHELLLFCWQTITDSPCAPVSVSSQDRAGHLGAAYQQRGGGVVAFGHQVFVFTDDHRVHCVDTLDMAACHGYAGGKPTSLADLGFAPLDPSLGVSGSNIDRVVDGSTGRIYHTLHIDDNPAAGAVWDTGVHLSCWDPVIKDSCADFAPYRLHETVKRQAGRLFLHRTAGGLADGVCSTGVGELTCVELDGQPSGRLDTRMQALEDQLPAYGRYSNGMGVHYWHENSNRLFLTTPRKLSEIQCWDFNTASFCGTLTGLAGGGETQDYGFVAEGNCIYGVGHNSVFWAFTPDMTPGCPGAMQEVTINKCSCEGEDRWGLISFEFDIGPDSPFRTLEVQAIDPEGNVVFPTDGSEWVSMIGRPSDVLDLSEVPTTHDDLRLRVYLETDHTDPWLAGPPPILLIGFSEIPHLVE